MNKAWKKLQAGLKERFRKFLVSLKRKPHMIPLFILGFGFMWYAMQLTKVSNATATISGAGMGLCGFVTMLFSILGLVCFGYSFPHRKPVNKVMLTLMFVMFLAVLYADYRYLSTVRLWVYKELSYANAGTVVNDLSLFEARQVGRIQTKHEIGNLLTGHMIITAIGLVMTALLPLYSGLIKKINTSVRVDENESMGAIELAGDEA